MIYLQEKNCLNCKTFRLENVDSGVCRVDKTVESYPVKALKDSCEKWADAGQQYYIRQGWIKKTLEKEE
ncbi:MAG: hypothetical protein DSY80_02000 [Desulfocapsa sp.]|nr:MAG: hypothetical protein DSY80_02000 [Desulfocapsa sp.]